MKTQHIVAKLNNSTLEIAKLKQHALFYKDDRFPRFLPEKLRDMAQELEKLADELEMEDKGLVRE
jgi:hypothetical protein